MEVPEFDLLARIENLEMAVGEAHLSAGDASNLAMHAFNLSFAAHAIHYPSDATRSRDSHLRKLIDVDFNERWLGTLAADLLKICEALEKQLFRHLRMTGELTPSVREPGEALRADAPCIGDGLSNVETPIAALSQALSWRGMKP